MPTIDTTTSIMTTTVITLDAAETREALLQYVSDEQITPLPDPQDPASGSTVIAYANNAETPEIIGGDIRGVVTVVTITPEGEFLPGLTG